MIREKNNEPLTKDFLGRVSPTKALILQYVANAPVYWYNPTYDCSWIWEGIELNMDLFNYFYSNIVRGRNITNNILNNTIPIFLAMGRYDYSAPYILWEDLINEIPNLTYYLFEKSGHYPMLEEQMLFDRRLINWIKKL
ncbi:MAG: alpha/beta fold hydrolase [Promethearchaeota archaeon]